jgi:hypothetical protein
MFVPGPLDIIWPMTTTNHFLRSETLHSEIQPEKGEESISWLHSMYVIMMPMNPRLRETSILTKSNSVWTPPLVSDRTLAGLRQASRPQKHK